MNQRNKVIYIEGNENITNVMAKSLAKSKNLKRIIIKTEGKVDENFLG